MSRCRHYWDWNIKRFGSGRWLKRLLYLARCHIGIPCFPVVFAFIVGAIPVIAEAKIGDDLVFVRQIRSNLIAEFSDMPFRPWEDVIVVDHAKNIHLKTFEDGIKRCFSYAYTPQFNATLWPKQAGEKRVLKNIDWVENIAPSKITIYSHTPCYSKGGFCGTTCANRVFHIFGWSVPAIFYIRNKPPCFHLLSQHAVSTAASLSR